MAFSDFTLERIAQTLGVTTRHAFLFPDARAVEVPAWLRDSLKKLTQLSTNSEKARSEFIVAPILLACGEVCPTPLAIFSGQRPDVDAALGLVGECDFILAATEPVPPLRAPIATIVEAKKNDIEAGLGQCVAQMVAARMFNHKAGRGAAPVFGCVTTGEVWQFLQLIGEAAAIDRRRYYLDNVEGILAAIREIVALCEMAQDHCVDKPSQAQKSN